MGKGWFGWVIRGQWEGQKVVVQVLKEESTALERRQFVEQSLKSSRVNDHENVLSLIGVSLDLPPLLALIEFCEVGDLKTFMFNSRGKYTVTNLALLNN